MSDGEHARRDAADRNPLRDAGRGAGEVDRVIVATITPDRRADVGAPAGADLGCSPFVMACDDNHTDRPEHAEREGRLRRGATVGLAAFGAGFVWAAGVVSWKERVGVHA